MTTKPLRLAFWAGLLMTSLLAALPARAEVALRIGHLAAGGDQGEAERLEAFRALLEERLERKVELVPHRGYPTLIHALALGSIDMAPLSARAFALGQLGCGCLDALALQPDGNGRTGYQAALAVPANGAIAHLSDLAGKRLVIVGEHSTAAHVVGLGELTQAGFGEGFVGAIRFAASIDEAARLLDNGEADALMSWTDGDEATPGGAFARLPGDRESLHFLWLSRPIAYGPFAMRRNADPAFRAQMIEALTSLSYGDETGDALAGLERGSGMRLVAAPQGVYQPLIAALSQAASR